MQTMTNKTMYRIAIGAAIAASLILIWLSLGVGIIGQDGDPANVMYFGVIAVGLIGAILARLRPNGMARTMLAMAFVQVLITAIALTAKLGLPWSRPLELILLNGFFVVVFLGSAWLFQRAGRDG